MTAARFHDIWYVTCTKVRVYIEDDIEDDSGPCGQIRSW
jgi:hypothetical protein